MHHQLDKFLQQYRREIWQRHWQHSTKFACRRRPGQSWTWASSSNQCLLYPRKRTCISPAVMSALWHERTRAVQQKRRSLDDLVRESEQLIGYGQTEALRCLEIDYQLKFGW